MAVAVAFPVALLLGVLADTAAGVLRRPFSRENPWRPLAGFAADVRLLVTNRDRVAAVEAVSAVLGLLGGTLAAAGAIGAGPSGAPFLYLALAIAAVGGHAAASLSDFGSVEARASRARLRFVLVEPAFVLGLTTGFLRWRATGLEAVRGAHEVLGSGLEVGPPLASAGLILAVAVILTAGALRLAPERGREPGSGGGPSLVVTLCRWSLSGATALVAGALLAGGVGAPDTARIFDAALLPMLVAAASGAVVLGGVGAGVASLPEAIRPLTPWAVSMVGAIALEMVILA
jgi:hypothetical protein